MPRIDRQATPRPMPDLALLFLDVDALVSQLQGERANSLVCQNCWR
jgi:hypothetical protein